MDIRTGTTRRMMPVASRWGFSCLGFLLLVFAAQGAGSQSKRPAGTPRKPSVQSITSITVTGAAAFPQGKVIQELGLQTNSRFDKAKLADGVRKLKRFYTDNGYAECEITPAVRSSADSNHVQIALNLREGRQYYVNRISFVGLPPGTDNRVKSAASDIEEGKVFRQGSVELSVQKINRLGVVRPIGSKDYRVEMKPDPGDPKRGRVDISFQVRPKQR